MARVMDKSITVLMVWLTRILSLEVWSSAGRRRPLSKSLAHLKDKIAGLAMAEAPRKADQGKGRTALTPTTVNIALEMMILHFYQTLTRTTNVLAA